MDRQQGDAPVPARGDREQVVSVPDPNTPPSTMSPAKRRRLVVPLSALAVATALVSALWATAGSSPGAGSDSGPAQTATSSPLGTPTAGSRDPIPVQSDLPEIGESQVDGGVPSVEPTEPPATDIGSP